MTETTTSPSTFLLGADLEIGRMGYGSLRLTGQPGNWGPPADVEGARAVLRRVVELGITFIDTADSYGPEVAETLIAEALHPYPEGLVIGTKAGAIKLGPGLMRRDGRPEHLRSAVEQSLRRLRLDRIDLLQYHWIDPEVPLEESVGTFAELRAEGKIRHIGLSNATEADLERALAVTPIASVQNPYSLADRSSDGVLRRTAAEGIAFMPYTPLLGGALAQRNGPLDTIAARVGGTPGQVALAWLLARSPNMVVIPGTSSIAHLEENVGAASLRLGEEELAALDRVLDGA